MLHAVLPPVVTGAVVMLIGFNLAPVVANIYWPQDQWVALATMTVRRSWSRSAFRGFIGRIAIFLGLIFGYLLSWVLDKTVGQITSVLGRRRPRPPRTCRVDWSRRRRRRLVRLPAADDRRPPTARRSSAGTCPTSRSPSILLVLPAVIALIAENTGHVKAVAEMTGPTSTR